MASLITDATATIKSTTYEAALLELMTLIKVAEGDLAKNPQNLDNISFAIDYDEKTFSGDFSFPVVISIADNGNLVTTAANYLTGLTYSSGTSTNTLKSKNAIGAAMELIQAMQLIESNTTKNPQALNKVTGKIDNEALTFAGTVTLDILLSVSTDGSVKVSAKEYLLS